MITNKRAILSYVILFSLLKSSHEQHSKCLSLVLSYFQRKCFFYYRILFGCRERLISPVAVFCYHFSSSNTIHRRQPSFIFQIRYHSHRLSSSQTFTNLIHGLPFGQTCAASHQVKSSQSHDLTFFQISKKVKVMTLTFLKKRKKSKS